MSFLRHGESIAPMRLVPLGASGLAHSQCSSDAMSSSRLFLGRLLSSRACLRFAGCERFSKTKPRRTMIFQRTATTPLTPCLTPRVHSTGPFPRAPFPDTTPQASSSGESSLATRLSTEKHGQRFRGNMKPQPGDISIVENTGTFLLWYDNSPREL